jgi:outer membrane lipoprotein SlyB
MNEIETIVTTNDSDELIGEPSHPVATGAGALIGGAAAGMVAGLAGGPIGAVVGAVVGAVGGGLGGDAVANSIDQVHEANRSKP